MDQPDSAYYVLVLEDEPSLSSAIQSRLKAAGVDSDIFDNGEQALQKITARGSHFDGIWLDFDVIGMNGVEFMQRFIAISGWERCPVLIVSNTGDPTLIQQAIALGAKEWIIKAEVRLDDTVSRFIELINKAKKEA